MTSSFSFVKTVKLYFIFSLIDSFNSHRGFVSIKLNVIAEGRRQYVICWPKVNNQRVFISECYQCGLHENKDAKKVRLNNLHCVFVSY